MKTQKTETKFFIAYLECALWSSMDEDGEPLDAEYGIDDIAPESLAQMRADCEDFQESFAELLAKAGSDEQNGHDFWLTRNHHGAGFWDRGYGEVGARLTEMSHPYGECNLYVGDDGKIHAS